MEYIDLHLHSSCSDGTMTPAELVQEAVRAGIRGIA
ncbi:MAG: phosphatase, partial [Desulfobacterales bacterium]